MKNMIILVSVLLLIAVAVWYMQPKTNHSEVTEESSPPLKEVATETLEPKEPNKSERVQRVADVWAWQKKEPEANLEAESRLFTEQSVHDALQAVRMDENGNVILDNDAQIALDEALERIYKRLDSSSLQELQDMIVNALPEPAGQQTAQLVADYQSFLQAKDQFSQMHANAPDAYSAQTPAAVAQDQALYADLQSLRALHLGQDAAQQLFALADTNAQFMFETMRLNFDTSLSAEDRARQMQVIQTQHQENVAALTPESDG